MDNPSSVIEDECEESIDNPEKEKGLFLDARHLSIDGTLGNKGLTK